MSTSSRKILICLGAAGLTLIGPAQPAPPRSETAATIRWRAFDASAFKDAKQEGKLVLLYIEAPWGHWDRIMSEITFADPKVIRLVTEKFIPIRADALLRPDIYTRYGMGGWPTTAFLLHTGQPLYFPDASRNIVKAGGTYYAAEPLAAYLENLADYYAANKEATDKAADEVATTMLSHKEVISAPVTAEMVEVAVTKLLQAYADWTPDPTVKAARYPDVDSAELAFEYYVRKGNRSVLDAMVQTLTDMGRGGIRDHLGGGFHRFAIDAAWRVPAFEKLLLVNAEALQAYTELYMLSLNGRYRAIAEDVVRYVKGSLTDPEGWFYPYQAADFKLGEDGDYYTWTLEEAKSVLAEEEEKYLLPGYDIGEWGELANTAPRRNVLFLAEGPYLLSQRLGGEEAKITEIFAAGRAKLLAARARRQAPLVGGTLIGDANAAMAASMITAGDALRQDDLRVAGLATIDLLWDRLRDTGTGLLDHAWSREQGRSKLALFSDQVQMTRALLVAHESTGEAKHLDRARQLTDAAHAAFEDKLSGGYMDRLFSAEEPGLLSWPHRSLRDNSMFAAALIRLHHLSDRPADEKHLKAARRTLESWGAEFSRYKELASPFGLAASQLLNPPVEVLVVGGPGDAGHESVLAQAKALYHPWKVTRHLTAQAARNLGPRQVKLPAEGASCIFCVESRCSDPYTEQDKLRVRMDEFLNPPKGPESPAPPVAADKTGQP